MAFNPRSFEGLLQAITSGQYRSRHIELHNQDISDVEVKQLFTALNSSPGIAAQITYLNLSQNALNITPDFSCLINLEELSLHDNNLRTPPNFFHNVKLQNVFLDSNQFITIPDFTRCKGLKELDLRFNHLTEASKIAAFCLKTIFPALKITVDLITSNGFLITKELIDEHVKQMFIHTFQQDYYNRTNFLKAKQAHDVNTIQTALVLKNHFGKNYDYKHILKMVCQYLQNENSPNTILRDNLTMFAKVFNKLPFNLSPVGEYKLKRLPLVLHKSWLATKRIKRKYYAKELLEKETLPSLLAFRNFVNERNAFEYLQEQNHPINQNHQQLRQLLKGVGL